MLSVSGFSGKRNCDFWCIYFTCCPVRLCDVIVVKVPSACSVASRGHLTPQLWHAKAVTLRLVPTQVEDIEYSWRKWDLMTSASSDGPPGIRLGDPAPDYWLYFNRSMDPCVSVSQWESNLRRRTYAAVFVECRRRSLLVKYDDQFVIKHHICVNSLRPRQNRRHFTEDVFKCNFLNENVWIPIKISLKFVPKGPINNIPALVQIMAWRRTGDKPLSEPMMTQFNDAYMRHSASMS